MSTVFSRILAGEIPASKKDGFDVMPPQSFHGSGTFYFQAPGGFTTEVQALLQQIDTLLVTTNNPLSSSL